MRTVTAVEHTAYDGRLIRVIPCLGTRPTQDDSNRSFWILLMGRRACKQPEAWMPASTA